MDYPRLRELSKADKRGAYKRKGGGRLFWREIPFPLKTPPHLSKAFERVGREALCTRRAQAVRQLEPREHTPLDLLCIAHLYVRIATT